MRMCEDKYYKMHPNYHYMVLCASQLKGTVGQGMSNCVYVTVCECIYS